MSKFLEVDRFPLGVWIDNQRGRKDELSEERIAMLETIPGWKWTMPHDIRWELGFSQLKKYGVVHGDYTTPDGYNLSSWMFAQRRKKRKNILTEQQIELLESIPGWWWESRGK